MRLITFRKGSSKPRVGALVGEAVLDLGTLAADLARERGTVRHGRGGFPKTMLDLIARGPDGLAAGRDIPREQALSHVFGYTIVNDVTARDLQKRHGQWFKGKSLDTFCPMGPVLVTADEIPDPQTLNITLRVNGETRQSSHTSKMIFPVDECIAVLSQGFTLLPGDVIATGTPEGVGAATGKFLKVGDKIEAEVERIGVLANRVGGPEMAPHTPQRS